MSGNVVASRPASLVESRMPGSEGFGMISPVKKPVNRRYINHKRAYSLMRLLPAKLDKKCAAFENLPKLQ